MKTKQKAIASIKQNQKKNLSKVKNLNIANNLLKIDAEIPKKNVEESLTSLLIQQFKRKKVECPICYNHISSESRIWNCVQCFQPFHLFCIVKWTQNSNIKKQKDQNLLSWSCPKCCYLYNEKTPQYLCFCGKISNPEYDSYLVLYF